MSTHPPAFANLDPLHPQRQAVMHDGRMIGHIQPLSSGGWAALLSDTTQTPLLRRFESAYAARFALLQLAAQWESWDQELLLDIDAEVDADWRTPL
ncbi:hypothetical protein [Magnetofaba australis]|uniref:hypothetical protein n=1 Tax=Magnetofaba australis TaxID=1472297 RepID=UPI000A19DFB6|nr:hypothetical protein [Magnetofaba australis]